ncbi:protein O-GlcNAcase isoform X1 [Hydra vulgaris]|uniref:protein O-GlcNAcase isoform X1 n=1 Tax=Hydra vulgaris TaxID=6087 RepID=UPI000640ECF7|nr:protein O-GlcNAcase [Hydra vulgaris]
MVVVEEKHFICGVVEGFYGRPWTCLQRKDLFSRMHRYSMNTYIYAPKDDIKHRALWRQLYTKEEESKIEKLVTAASFEGITFVYAISPGLDIMFSSEADVNALKRKMKQVSRLGCKAFALLFDDINPTLKPSDALIYKSSGHAQAILTNELFDFLKRPQFLFCPTEYCKTRAIPSVSKSEYLNTLGTTLHKEIDIMWTGDKVIPETITKESIQELGHILQRKPVIWDNIHANDYDQRRVFLGAYCGRSIELYSYLNGILTNPNCEFEANFVPIHTLGTWCRIASNSFNSNDALCFDDVPMAYLSDDENPNNSNEMTVDLLPSLTVADVASIVLDYNAKDALKLALCDWINEFSRIKKAPLKSYSKRNLKATLVNGQTVLSAIAFDMDHPNRTSETIASMIVDKSKSMQLTIDCISLLAELFYLPYEHGEKGNLLLQDFIWLLKNVCDIYEQPPSKEKVSCWFDRLLHCDQLCNEIYILFENFCKIPNEAILYDLYPYLWDLKEVLLSLQTYVKWLSDSISSSIPLVFFEPCSVESFNLLNVPISNDYIEPWHINYLGGLTVHLHRLLPFKGGYIFLDNAPDIPSSNVIKLRTYLPNDKESLYDLCSSLSANKLSVTEKTFQKNDFAGDTLVGCYISKFSKTLFIVEDNDGVCGFIASVPNNKVFVEHIESYWLSEIKVKYPESESYSYKLPNSPEWRNSSSSHLTYMFKSNVYDECVVKRLFNSVLCVLKTCGSTTTYYQLSNDSHLDMYMKMGFYPVENISEKLIFRIL